MLKTGNSVNRIINFWRSMGLRTTPTLDKGYFLNRLKEISNIQENRNRRIYKCDLRLDLIKQYPKREKEITDWLLKIIHDERSDIDFALEAMHALEQIDWERAMKELKYYKNDANEKIQSTARRIVTCHLSQVIERDFRYIFGINPYMPFSSEDRSYILHPLITLYSEELVTVSLARLALDLNSSFTRVQALLSLQEINPDKTVDALISE